MPRRTSRSGNAYANMKSLLIFAALFAATIASAQTKAVLKNISGSTITESLTIGSGKTLTIASGATINATGATITGFGSGGGPTALDDLTDATITAVATNDFFVKGASAWVNLTPTNARTALGLGTLATQSGTISDYLTIAAAASAYQPLDADLTAVAALTTTAAGLALLDDANASAQRTTLGLGTLATQSGTITDYLTSAAAASTYQAQTLWLASLNTAAGAAPNAVLHADGLGGFTATETGAAGFAILTSADATALRTAVLPSKTSNGGKFLRVNAGATDYELATISGGGDALTSGTLAQFAATTSAQLTGILSDESGTGVILTTTGSAANLTNFPTLNQNTSGNAATVTTNANLTGPVTSVGNATAIANGAISNAMLANGAVANLSGTNTGDQSLAAYLTSATASSTYQPLDSDLTSIAALVTTAAGLALLDDADASAQRTTLGLGTLATQSATITDYLTTASAASTYQPLDADLTDLADGSLTGTLVAAATTSARGSVELATDGETAASVAVQGSDARLVNATKVEIGIALSDETSDNTASSTVPKVTFRMPFAMTITSLRCSLTKAATGGELVVDVHLSGATIMTTNKLSVDASELTSTTAATSHTLTTTSVSDDSLLELFIDQVGTTTDNTGEGVKIWIIGTR